MRGLEKIYGDRHPDIQTDTHFNTMNRPGLRAGPIENPKGQNYLRKAQFAGLHDFARLLQSFSYLDWEMSQLLASIFLCPGWLGGYKHPLTGPQGRAGQGSIRKINIRSDKLLAIPNKNQFQSTALCLKGQVSICATARWWWWWWWGGREVFGVHSVE